MSRIVGIGTDIVKIARIEKMLDRRADQLPRRILTEAELEEFNGSQRQAAFLAKRFAVKEAVAKAFGLGFRQGLAYSHIGVAHDEFGKPQLVFHDKAAELIKENRVKHHHVSLSDEVDYVVAFVVLER